MASFSSEPEVSAVDPSSQHIRDIKLAIEFKYMMKHAPGGVFLMPTLDNNRELHGVIFLRRALYRNGVFRFKVLLPNAYNSVNTHPKITFTPPIFNPLIHPETGALDLLLEESLRSWNPEKHFLLTAMTFLKSIFYMRNFDKYTSVPNEDAKALFQNDKEAYLKRVTQCVEESLARVYDAPEPGCLITFTEPKPAHYNLRLDILGAAQEGEDDAPIDLGKETFYDASNEAEDDDDRDTDRRIADDLRAESRLNATNKALEDAAF